jgi:diaminopimelate decarboxylase
MYLEVISNAIEEHALESLLEDPKIIIELGRAIVAEAVDLAIPVLSAETRDGKRCLYFNDGIYTCFIDAVVHGWKYAFKTIPKKGHSLSARMVPFELFGRTCDSGDTLGEIDLPKNIREGDYLWVKSAGAYLDSVASGFNGFDPPKYVTYNP